MTEIISVRFKSKGKTYFFDPNGITVEKRQNVIVETSKGLEFAECVQGNHMVEDDTLILPLRPVIRIAAEEDIKRAEDNKQREAAAFEICQNKIKSHGLDMKLVDVEYNFEGSKILFFFTSDGRVDFRDLVKDLASVFKTRIELRQIGVRDEARMLGGFGICGKPFCCSQFLDDFQPVSIKMAKTQGLSLNPAKISGTCGRLMCCLKYEQDAYEDLVKSSPKVDAFVDTPAGKGLVMDINLLRRKARVHMEDPSDSAIKVFDFDDLEVLGGKAKRAEYLLEQEKLREAGVQEKENTVRHRPKLDVTSELAKKPSGEESEGERRKNRGRFDKQPNRNQKRVEQKPRPERKPKPTVSSDGKPTQEPNPDASQNKPKPEHRQHRQWQKRDSKPRPDSKPKPEQNANAESEQKQSQAPKHQNHRRPRPDGNKSKSDENKSKPGDNKSKPEQNVKSGDQKPRSGGKYHHNRRYNKPKPQSQDGSPAPKSQNK